MGDGVNYEIIEQKGNDYIVRMPRGVFKRFSMQYKNNDFEKDPILSAGKEALLSDEEFDSIEDLFDDLNN